MRIYHIHTHTHAVSKSQRKHPEKYYIPICLGLYPSAVVCFKILDISDLLVVARHPSLGNEIQYNYSL